MTKQLIEISSSTAGIKAVQNFIELYNRNVQDRKDTLSVHLFNNEEICELMEDKIHGYHRRNDNKA